jgi:hypothetical protein
VNGNISAIFTNQPTFVSSLRYGELINYWSGVKNIVKSNGKGLLGVFILSITCGGFDFDGVGFCVAFKVGVGAVKG